jgi:hypothetical protein
MTRYINTDLSIREEKGMGTGSCKFPVLISNTLKHGKSYEKCSLGRSLTGRVLLEENNVYF